MTKKDFWLDFIFFLLLGIMFCTQVCSCLALIYSDYWWLGALQVGALVAFFTFVIKNYLESKD